MNTYRELVYLILDEIKGESDDFTYTEEHIIYLLNKYRATVLSQRYKKVTDSISQSNYQIIKIGIEESEIERYCNSLDLQFQYYKSKEPIPNILIGEPRVWIDPDYYGKSITFISNDRMEYVGYNRYLKSTIYCSLGVDGYLYFKVNSTIDHILQDFEINILISGVFEDANINDSLLLDEDKQCDHLDKTYPLEESLVPTVIQMIFKELLGAAWRPTDLENNAQDDLANLATFLARNLKSKTQKQIEGDE